MYRQYVTKDEKNSYSLLGRRRNTIISFRNVRSKSAKSFLKNESCQKSVNVITFRVSRRRREM